MMGLLFDAEEMLQSDQAKIKITDSSHSYTMNELPEKDTTLPIIIL